MSRIGICVGHSRKLNGVTEGGSVSVGRVNEHAYNRELALMIEAKLDDFKIPCFIVASYQGNGYTAAQKWLAGHLKEKGATAAIELHFNHADSVTATGHEFLFWASSKNGRTLAKELDASMLEMFPDFKQRGIKPKGSGDRGAEFLKLTHCPAVISEPFFGSNPEDWKLATEKKAEIALAIAVGIKHYVSGTK